MSFFHRSKNTLPQPQPPTPQIQQAVIPHINPQQDSYDNIFPHVDVLASRIATTPIKTSSQAARKLLTPNNEQSGYEFLYDITSRFLTRPQVDIAVWSQQQGVTLPTNQPTDATVRGYTILPEQARQHDGYGTPYWQYTQLIDGRPANLTLTRDTVISLRYSTHPKDPTQTVTPLNTVKKWATVDDMIADYQTGFFGNSAVPAGMMCIVASTADEFNQTKTQMEQAFRGAVNTNQILYSMTPIDPLTGSPTPVSKITWVPFQKGNSDLALADLNTIASQHLTQGFGVPDIVRGLDTGQTYANAQQAEYSFVEYRLEPLLNRIYDRLEHELSRILRQPVAITYLLDMPLQSDVEKIKAETENVKTQSLLNLINAGYGRSQAAAILGLPDSGKQQPSGYARPTGLGGLIRQWLQDLLRGGRTDLNRLTRLVSQRLAPRLRQQARTEGEGILPAIFAYAEDHPQLAKTMGSLGADNIKSMYDFDERRALDLLHDRVYDSLKGVERTTLDRIREINGIADREQWDAETLESKLADVCSQSRSEYIAANSVADSQRVGSETAMRNLSQGLGVRLTKTWTTTDSKPCPICAALNGVTIDLGADWDVDGVKQATVGAHPNCRCVALYHVSQ